MRILSAMVLVVVMANVSVANDEIIFEGCDRKMATTYGETCRDWTIQIVKRTDSYYMLSGKVTQKMEVARHKNMSKSGLSLTLVDRIGEPNLYYVVLGKKLFIYDNCEFGSCDFYKRSIKCLYCL